MAFPTTSPLTSFTGADENPLSEGGVWSSPQESGISALKRLSNAAASAGATSGESYRNDISVADAEAYVDVPTLPLSGHGAAVWLRIQNPGNATTATGYLFAYVVGTGFQLYKLVGTTFTQIGATFTPHTLAAGEQIGASVVGTTITGYYGIAGVWTSVNAFTSSAVTGAGNIGLSVDDTTTRLDNFGGGAFVAGTPSLIFGDRHTRRSTLLRL